MRLGLCCIFKEESIKFRRATAAYVLKMSRKEQLKYIDNIVFHNVQSLLQALKYCASHGIGDFRINSQLLPLITHPDAGYRLNELPNYDNILNVLESCRKFSVLHDVRTTLHPDQFILLSSPSDKVTDSSIKELIAQAEFAEITGTDVINIHGGGAYGDKKSALQRVHDNFLKLPDIVKKRITFENDDKVYTPEDLLPLCELTGVPLVYDVHHHRCLTDGLSVEQATEKAMNSWNREPLFHISSPRNGWKYTKTIRMHHDYIDISDFPECWKLLDITVEVEAKAKECAVLQLMVKFSSEEN